MVCTLQTAYNFSPDSKCNFGSQARRGRQTELLVENFEASANDAHLSAVRSACPRTTFLLLRNGKARTHAALKAWTSHRCRRNEQLRHLKNVLSPHRRHSYLPERGCRCNSSHTVHHGRTRECAVAQACLCASVRGVLHAQARTPCRPTATTIFSCSLIWSCRSSCRCSIPPSPAWSGDTQAEDG